MIEIIDVVMISSLGKPGYISEFVKEYRLVFIDECNHSVSDTAKAVVKEIFAETVMV